MPMPLNNEKSSLRNLGSIFGREVDKTDAKPLSEFQQQSLAVFESEHMWAHFKANLAERNIHTAAGVRAMLPEFVNDRVLDGSLRSERSVYPTSMRRQGLDVYERFNSIDAGQDAKGLSKVIPARLSIDISSRSRKSSAISSLGCCDAPSIDGQPNSSGIKRSADVFNSFTSLESLSSSILSTLGLTKEVSIDSSFSATNRKSGSVSGRRPKFVRPVDFDPQSTEQNTTDIFSGNSVQVSNVTNTEVDTIRSKPFSYRPIRMEKKGDRKIEKSAQSVSSRDTSVTDSLLVEWGENDELSSDDEADEKDSRMLNDSESTAVMNRKDLIVDWNDKEDDDDDWI